MGETAGTTGAVEAQAAEARPRAELGTAGGSAGGAGGFPGWLEGKPWQVLTGTGLKWVAVATMLVDHIGAVLVYAYYLQLYRSGSSDAHQVYDFYMLLRTIGRIAFPLFCFVLVEGFVHTHSKPKYALRLLLFAIVSEIPYDLALHNADFSYTSQLNIMFTLLLAFCALWLADEIGRALKLPTWGTALLTAASVAGAAALANGPLDVSYHAYGVVLVGVLYIGRNHRWLQFVLGCAATAWYCVENASMLQMYCAIGLACIVLYNGKRGRGMKYFFYLFYPLHLLVLGLLKIWLF